MFFKQRRLPMMCSQQAEMLCCQEMFFDAIHHQGEVTFADFGYQDADRHAALVAQGTRQIIGPIVQFVGGCQYALPGGRGDRLRRRRSFTTIDTAVCDKPR